MTKDMTAGKPLGLILRFCGPMVFGNILQQLYSMVAVSYTHLVRGQHYRYPHDYPNHYVRQQYLPDILKDKVYYQFGENRQEQAAAAYREKILREDQT